MKSNFQIILTAFFIVAIVAGVIAFSTGKQNQSTDLKPIVLWGTLDGSLFERFLSQVNLELENPLKVTYVQKDSARFDTVFVEAIASGKGPDAVILPQDFLLRFENKLIAIPYDVYPERDFKDTFIEQSELYLTDSGIVAFPFTIDPVVMYWNRNIFTNAGIATHPKFWDEFAGLVPKMTLKDNALNIKQSTIAFGEYRNIQNAKEVVATLMMQAGNPLVERSVDGVRSVMSKTLGMTRPPSEDALLFYTSFSNPARALYSWNRSLSQDKSMFIRGDLGVYFGFASELQDIRAKNPNLNFDVALLPQAPQGKNRVTYGRMEAFAIARSTADVNNTLSVLNSLLSSSALLKWTEITKLPPVRRDLLGKKPKDPYLSVFYDSSLISRAWLDPQPQETNLIFKDMIEAIVGGRASIHDAVSVASDKIDNLLNK